MWRDENPTGVKYSLCVPEGTEDRLVEVVQSGLWSLLSSCWLSVLTQQRTRLYQLLSLVFVYSGTFCNTGRFPPVKVPSKVS